MSLVTRNNANPQWVTGTFTSAACCAVDVTENIGFQPTYVKIAVNTSGTNPDVYEQHASEADESMLTTGSTGVITSPAIASGITITSTGFTLAAATQTASGVNWYIASR
jgi:hypothetical protein